MTKLRREWLFPVFCCLAAVAVVTIAGARVDVPEVAVERRPVTTFTATGGATREGAESTRDDRGGNEGNLNDGRAEVYEGKDAVCAYERRIVASYTGEYEVGSIIDNSSPLHVRYYDSDGSSQLVSGWTVENPGEVVANQRQIFVILYEDLRCELELFVRSTDPTSPSFEDLDSKYEEIEIREYMGDIHVPVGKKVRASFMVDKIFENDDGTTEVSYGWTGQPAVLVSMPSSLGDQVNNHTDITFYGTVQSRGFCENAGQHTDCFQADYIRIDSRYHEQFVKPNQISDARKK